ncbi:Scr1 family TA system antitoxin-like transcriptional regulator [Actinomadura viridis]|uniref:helix-turn-helix domain-containing protein n=1 Tax=Actinomadura viridis TaxID=58110 RepID=UPI0036760DA2
MRPCTHIDPRESLRAQFAYTLRTLRTLKGLSQEQLAKELYLSRESITAYETQRNFPDLDTCKQFDDFFGTGELFQGQWTHAQREHVHEWFETYLAHENEATQIRTFQPLYIPGLLQTEAYMRAMTNGRELSDEVIAQRLARHKILAREDSPPHLFAIVDQTAISRPVGGAEVMKEQLKHLLAMSELPNVSIQVVLESVGWYLGFRGGLVSLIKPGNRPVGYVEAQFGGRLIEDPPEAARLGLRFDQIRGRALSEHGSRTLIGRTMEVLQDDPVAEEQLQPGGDQYRMHRGLL